MRAIFVCAHGAGGHKDDRGILRLAEALEPRGFEVVRFNFPYREKGSKLPDPMTVLKECIVAIAEKARKEEKGLLLGGHSFPVAEEIGQAAEQWWIRLREKQ